MQARERAMKDEPHQNLDEQELLHLAMEAGRAQRHGEALDYLKRAVARPQASASAHFLLGAHHAQIGLVDRAVEEFQRALELEPRLAAARFQLGFLLIGNARVEEGLAALEPLEALGAADPYFHFKHAVAHLCRDEFEPCAAALRQGMELNRANPPLNAEMQRLLEQVEAAAGGKPPQSGADQPGQILLKAYTKTLN
jgi:tetratricopeptide (TPR) repeat protein